MAQVWVRTHVIPSMLHVSCVIWCVCLIYHIFYDTSIYSIFLTVPSLLSPCPSFCPSTSSSRMWWTNPLCNSAEDLGTLAENEPHTKYRGKIGHVQQTLHSWWTKKIAYPITQIDDYDQRCGQNQSLSQSVKYPYW